MPSTLGDQWRHTSGPVAAPNAVNLFDSQRCLGGVLVLYALRRQIGEAAFSAAERAFLERHRDATAAVPRGTAQPEGQPPPRQLRDAVGAAEKVSAEMSQSSRAGVMSPGSNSPVRCCGMATAPCWSATVRAGAGMRMPSAR